MLASAVCLSGFAGCANSETQSAPAGESAASPSEAASTNETADHPEEVTGSFSYWSFTDSTNNLVNAFQEQYPGIKVDFHMFGGEDYKTKVMTTMQSGQDIPDVFDLEASYVYEFLDSDLLQNLSELGFEEEMADFYPYVLATSTFQWESERRQFPDIPHLHVVSQRRSKNLAGNRRPQRNFRHAQQC